MHNGLPRCKAPLFPLFRECMEFKKKKTTKTTKANVRSVSASIPFVLKGEKDEMISPHTAELAHLAFGFQAEGQFRLLADGWARSPPLAPRCGGAASAAALPPAGTSLPSWSVVNSSCGHRGERRRVLELSKGQCCLSGSCFLSLSNWC